MFITFEGIDFSGKSTQARLLNEYFKQNKIDSLLLREPGGTVISEKIREILLDKKNEINDLTEFLLFSSSRCQLTEEVIKPKLKNGSIVICDRYYDSSTAYQGYGGKIPLDTINSVNTIASGGLVPDITFLINISFEESLKRRSASRRSDDRMEQKEKEYFNDVVNGYLMIAEKEPDRFRIINGTGDINIIHKVILSSVSDALSNFKIKS
jgi:dTMP kinase